MSCSAIAPPLSTLRAPQTLGFRSMGKSNALFWTAACTEVVMLRCRYYSLFTLGMLVMFECTVVTQRMRNLKELRSLQTPKQPIQAYRHGKWGQLPGDALLPGDLVSIGRPRGGEQVGLVRRRQQRLRPATGPPAASAQQIRSGQKAAQACVCPRSLTAQVEPAARALPAAGDLVSTEVFEGRTHPGLSAMQPPPYL